MRLLRRKNDPALFADLIDSLIDQAVFGWSIGAPGRAYYHATLDDCGEDLSFLIEDQGRAIVALSCNIRDGRLELFGQAAEILTAAEITPAIAVRAMQEAMGEINRIAGAAPSGALLLTRSLGLEPDALTAALMSAGYQPEPYFCAVVDLAEEPEAIARNMRKGHRQQVKWGRDNLAIAVVDASRPDIEKFRAYRKLHADVAGHATRGDDSWNAMEKAVVSGKGRLILSHFEGLLVGGTLVLDSGGVAYYASGAYRREHFDKPLAHYPLFVAMQRSAEAGRRWFNLGDVSTPPTLSDKERSIAYFKRGFASTLRSAMIWKSQSKNPAV